MGGCKADAAGTADKVKQGAFKLGAALAHLEEYDAATNLAGHALAEAQGNRYAAAVAQLLAPILAEQARQGAAIDLLQSAERDGSAALAREDIAEGVKVGDRFEWVTPGAFFRRIGTVTKNDGDTGRFLETGDFVRWFNVDALLDDALFTRLPRGPKAIAIGDCFRWVGGALDGEIGEVTHGPWEREEGTAWRLQTGVDSRLLLTTVLLDAAFFKREPNVPAVPADDEAVNERLAVAADFDLDGPAGERLASAPTPEAIPAAVAQERLAAHFASVGSSVSRADLDGLLDDVAKLVAIRQGHEHDTTTEVFDIYNAIDALALRAGQLRPSRLTGGQ